MPIYRLSLWSEDLRRFIECRLGDDRAPVRLDEFDEAGRCALKLSASGIRLRPKVMGAGGWVRASP